MIDTRILKSLESNFQDPSYSIVISKFEQPESCNKDSLHIYMTQFTPSLESIIENNENVIEELKGILKQRSISIPNLPISKVNSCIQKKLSIESLLDYNTTDGLFVSGLTGTLENDVEKDITKRYLEGIINKKKVIITENDVPNFFNITKFRIKGNSLIISIPKSIDTLNVTLKKQNQNTNATSIYNESNIQDGKITINIDSQATYSFTIQYTIKTHLINHTVESIITPLSRQIDLSFQNKYTDLPAVIPTIDEEHKVYASYDTSFKKDSNGYYTGVTISFKGLKRQKEYGNINITIIGYKV